MELMLFLVPFPWQRKCHCSSWRVRPRGFVWERPPSWDRCNDQAGMSKSRVSSCKPRGCCLTRNIRPGTKKPNCLWNLWLWHLPHPLCPSEHANSLGQEPFRCVSFQIHKSPRALARADDANIASLLGGAVWAALPRSDSRPARGCPVFILQPGPLPSLGCCPTTTCPRNPAHSTPFSFCAPIQKKLPYLPTTLLLGGKLAVCGIICELIFTSPRISPRVFPEVQRLRTSMTSLCTVAETPAFCQGSL